MGNLNFPGTSKNMSKKLTSMYNELFTLLCNSDNPERKAKQSLFKNIQRYLDYQINMTENKQSLLWESVTKLE